MCLVVFYVCVLDSVFDCVSACLVARLCVFFMLLLFVCSCWRVFVVCVLVYCVGCVFVCLRVWMFNCVGACLFVCLCVWCIGRAWACLIGCLFVCLRV